VGFPNADKPPSGVAGRRWHFEGCRDVAAVMHYGWVQKPFRQARRDPHSISLVQGRGHGPTASTGADVNSVREPTAQKISTGRPSQPQRPPGSMQWLSRLGTMHLPLLSQPPVKPQRWPEGHSESFLQLATLWEAPTLGPPVVVVCAWVLEHPTSNH